MTTTPSRSAESVTASVPSATPVEPVSPTPHPAPRALPADTDVVLQPLRRDDKGCGVYDVSAEMLVKELRSLGVTAAFADPPESRLFRIQHSAASDIVLAIVINLASTGAIEALKTLVRRRAPSNARVDLSLTTVSADGERRDFRASGNGDQVAAVINSLRGND